MSVSPIEHNTRAPQTLSVVPSNQEQPDIMVVGGGKGGVGKTCFAVNAAVEIARRGWRTVLVDADLGCSNVETVLGMRAPTRLDTFFNQRDGGGLREVLCDTPYGNLQLVPGTSGLLDASHPRFRQKSAFHDELRLLDADVVVVDLDAGAHLDTLDLFLLGATHGIVIITPERTSIDNAFKFLRGALYRRIERFYESPELGVLLKRSESLPGFIERLYRARLFDGATCDRICDELVALARSFQPRIVVNKANTAYEAQVAASIMAKHCRRHLLIRPDSLGMMFFDPTVSEAVNSGVPFVVGRPQRKVSGCIVNIANRLGYF